MLSFVAIAIALLLVHGRLWAAIMSQVVVLARGELLAAVSRSYQVAPFSLRWNQEVGRGTLGFGAKSYVQTLAAHLHYRIDLYLIALLADPGAGRLLFDRGQHDEPDSPDPRRDRHGDLPEARRLVGRGRPRTVPR